MNISLRWTGRAPGYHDLLYKNSLKDADSLNKRGVSVHIDDVMASVKRYDLASKITDQNIYLKNPLQKINIFKNSREILEEYFTLKIPYKNPKYF